MTSYGSTTITYDTIGNPTAIGSATLTWQGRQLMQYVNGGNTYAYTYNDEGIRTSKTINGVKHTYHLSGSQIVAEEWGNNLLVYLYDAEGAPLGMQYRNTTYAANVFDTYWFEKNMQGDIIAVYNDAGTLLISYLYDAWGNVTTTYSNGGASTNAVYNPFKYRGYYHDSETGWYYLQSRYYNPTWGRFINADGYVSTGTGLLSYNMFAYCNNNPVLYMDKSGCAPFSITGFFIQLFDEIINFMDACEEAVYYGFAVLPNYLADSLVVDIGIGAGIGIGAEAEGISAAAQIRSDFFTIRKDSGENSNFYFGRADEQFILVEGLHSVIGTGELNFYDLNGHKHEPITVMPHFDPVSSFGGSLYFLCLGGTVSIGFDWEYFFDAVFGG